MGFPTWAATDPQTPEELARIYAHEVNRRLEVPPEEALAYGVLLQKTLGDAGLHPIQTQYVILVDRSPFVQALMIFWLPTGSGSPVLIGASPASTGKAGSFEHFLTPLGVFDHTLDNPDFRAEGTRNDNGIRGYGARGLRVFDFGWQTARKTWGDHALSKMRLQIHATDPDLLEPQLGTARSKGCIRIPATLNRLIDHHGLLDAEYERAAREGHDLWVLQPDRAPAPWPGRYLVVVETRRQTRPDWSPAGENAQRAPRASSGTTTACG